MQTPMQPAPVTVNILLGSTVYCLIPSHACCSAVTTLRNLLHRQVLSSPDCRSTSNNTNINTNTDQNKVEVSYLAAVFA